VILRHAWLMDDTRADRAQAQLRAGVYGRLSETYDAADSVPTQMDRGTCHAARRGWTVVATFKDDGYCACPRDGACMSQRACTRVYVQTRAKREMRRTVRRSLTVVAPR
jgi:hypothetical protein